MRVHYDTIHKPVVEFLRCHGFSVANTAMVGSGFGDIVVGRRLITDIVEIKTGDAPFEESQKVFHAQWRGAPIVVIRSMEAAEEWIASKK